MNRCHLEIISWLYGLGERLQRVKTARLDWNVVFASFHGSLVHGEVELTGRADRHRPPKLTMEDLKTSKSLAGIRSDIRAIVEASNTPLFNGGSLERMISWPRTAFPTKATSIEHNSVPWEAVVSGWNVL
jgi:hypothetical protein